MPCCPSCAHHAPDDGRFCPACGAPLNGRGPELTRTTMRTAASSTPHSTPVSLSSSSPVSASHGRFVPGTLLGERYRIVGLLGAGGMGEVYRADDLKLDQAVALKFLPQMLEGNEARLQRLLSGVRIARQISHANICRVYDVDEVDGRHFISMEYVDGEDLAGLLKRIGRLPRDKAIQVARQICAGLAAAHDQGILHRDLKPANVMLDGRGRARITDFDLAVAAGGVSGAETSVGTPGYMAPEQRAGREVTVRSDLYSLGLVLYELFTGQPAFKAGTLAELERLQTESELTSPSTLVENLDPAVERAILRCLESDPRDRPASALEVAAALPGGDPLAAALAAGETPSPEMVAAAGESGGLRRSAAWTCLGLALTGLVLVAISGPSRKLAGMVGLPKSPEVLTERAREIVKKLGHDDPPLHSAHWLSTDGEWLNHIEDQDQAPDRWKRLAERDPAAIRFDYRASPQYLVPQALAWGTISLQDPPRTVSGMVTLELDPEGRLTFFEAIPPERDPTEGPQPAPAWAALFDEAGVDTSRLHPVPPMFNPLVDCDARAAWEGPSRSDPTDTVRYEAGAYRGKPIWFETRYPWERAARMEAYRRGGSERINLIAVVGIYVLIFGGGAFLARRNLRLGRGDRRGAFRLAMLLIVATMVGWASGTRHVPEPNAELSLLFSGFGLALLNGGLLWLVYMALEPFVRRAWPDTLISWNRVVMGRLHDPRIGRDLLLGCVFGVLARLVGVLAAPLDNLLGFAPRRPEIVLPLTGLHDLAVSLSALLVNSPSVPFLLLFFLVLFRVILRKPWLAAGAVFLVFATLAISQPRAFSPSTVVLASVVIGGFLFLLFRFGALATIVAEFVGGLLRLSSLSTDLSTWYAGYDLFLATLVVALAAYGFYTSLAGRPLFGESRVDFQ